MENLLYKSKSEQGVAKSTLLVHKVPGGNSGPESALDVSAPKLSTIKYLECENHVSEEFFLASTVSISSSLPY